MPITTALQNAQKHRRELYAFAKRNGLNVRWKMKTQMMESIVAPFKQAKASKIATAFKKAKLSTDKSYLDAINQTSGKVDVSLIRFNKIRKQIVSPGDKKLLIHIKGSDGRIEKSYHLNDRIVNMNNLFIDEENQYSSGADVELNILPTTNIETEWLPNPKSSRSERKNFFRYLTLAEYNLHAFQVYSDDFLIEDDYNENSFVPGESDDEDGANYPCFLFALYKAGAKPDLVKQISQTMFNSGATVDFIRKTAKAFNICISVKQFRIDQKAGRAKNDTTVYGDKRNTMFILGSVGEHLFAIAPTNIAKGALDNSELVAKHGRTDFRIKGGRAVFNDKKISFLDSYAVISYLYHHRESHLTPITQQNMPKLLNNKYQEVRSLTEGDFSASNFRLMGRVPGKEVKLGQAVLRAFNSKTRDYYDVRKYNVIYFDFETLVIDNVHVPCCVSKNLLWPYNAGFDARFLLKHMSYSSKDTNMIDCCSKIKQAHGFYKKREILIKDAMSFLAGGLSRLSKMFKDASSSLSLEKECFPHALINESNFRSLWPLEYHDSYESKDTFIDNATMIGAIIDGRLNCEMYATHYFNRDVDVLKVCFEAFRGLVMEEFDLDIYRFLSVSFLSLAFQHNEGFFDVCYEMNSVLLGFLRQGTVGGRVMARDNGKY
ncbi:unnamed protein product [Phytophthora fragariaefolia]|uniref:DNA-directed DNA polymerase n=1 Tax=Phytophthora fragariaefolia TaxID=1490495 RepID=A0A9W6UF14_9STRA|nr:unnamed protein product [Phytophthora fragariaefolia]